MITLSFFLASFFIVGFSNLLIVNRINNRNYDMFLGRDSLKARISCDVPFSFSPQNLGDNFVIYNMISANGAYDSDWVRAVYGIGDFPMPAMKDGRFFTNDDFVSEEPTCVLGLAAAARSSETEGDTEYYTFEGVKYRILGHMGTEEISDLDVIVMLNWGGYFNNKAMYSGTYIIDSDNLSESTRAFENLKYLADNAENVKFYTMVHNPTIRSFDTYSKTLYPISLAILIMSIIIISYFYIDSISHRIAVKKLVGFSSLNLFLEVAGEFVCFALAGMTCAVIALLLLAANERYASSELGYFTVIRPQTMIYAVIATVFFALILSLPAILFVYRTDTGKKLK